MQGEKRSGKGNEDTLKTRPRPLFSLHHNHDHYRYFYSARTVEATKQTPSIVTPLQLTVADPTQVPTMSSDAFVHAAAGSAGGCVAM